MIAWQFARNLLAIFVGTAGIVGFAFAPLAKLMRFVFAATAVAILIPPHAFPGADLLDWVGLAGAVVVLGFNYLHGRTDKQTATPSQARP